MNNLIKGKKNKFTYSLEVKTSQIHQDLHVKMQFCQKVVLLTKIRPKIRLFWKKFLISDHGLLKRTIVGTLDMSTLTDKKYVKKTGILLTVFSQNFILLSSWHSFISAFKIQNWRSFLVGFLLLNLLGQNSHSFLGNRKTLLLISDRVGSKGGVVFAWDSLPSWSTLNAAAFLT